MLDSNTEEVDFSRQVSRGDEGGTQNLLWERVLPTFSLSKATAYDEG